LFLSSPSADRTPLTRSNNGGTFLAIELGNKHLQPHRLRPFRLFIRRDIAGDASDRSSRADRSRQDRAASKKTVTAVLRSDQADVSVGSKGKILAGSRCFPLCPRKRTQIGHRAMSVSCQKRKCPLTRLIQTISGAAAQREGLEWGDRLERRLRPLRLGNVSQ
jgi:hypothetical protein